MGASRDLAGRVWVTMRLKLEDASVEVKCGWELVGTERNLNVVNR